MLRYTKSHFVLPIFLIISLISCDNASEDDDSTPASENPGTNEETQNSENSENTTVIDGTIVNTVNLVALGEKIFIDVNLSTPSELPCAGCHGLDIGLDDPNDSVPTSAGSDGVSFGSRNAPTVSYTAFVPERSSRNNPQTGQDEVIGGMFIDGRADNLEEQAKKPFLNPIEMGNESEEEVIEKIRQSVYANDFEALFGAGVLSDTARSFNYIADALAAFQRSSAISPFTSLFDRVKAGTATFNRSQRRGEDLFNGRAECSTCHDTDADIVVFSDFEYKNTGVPSNPLVPALMEDPTFIDLGLGGETNNMRDRGKFRTPTLRNIAVTAPYMHNGVFLTLEEVIDFYNTRDTTFPDAPEVPQTINQARNIGELELTEGEIADLAAFMRTLTDQ